MDYIDRLHEQFVGECFGLDGLVRFRRIWYVDFEDPAVDPEQDLSEPVAARPREETASGLIDDPDPPQGSEPSACQASDHGRFVEIPRQLYAGDRTKLRHRERLVEGIPSQRSIASVVSFDQPLSLQTPERTGQGLRVRAELPPEPVEGHASMEGLEGEQNPIVE